MKDKYVSIDAWNELILTLYGEKGKQRIETIIKYMELGMMHWLPKWIVLVGGARSGKSTLITILSRMFEDGWIYIGVTSSDYGQYNRILSIAPDVDFPKLYQNVTENFSFSTDYHILAETKKEPENSKQFEEVEFIHPTGNTLSKWHYDKCLTIICEGIPELKLYFRLLAEKQFPKRLL